MQKRRKTTRRGRETRFEGKLHLSDPHTDISYFLSLFPFVLLQIHRLAFLFCFLMSNLNDKMIDQLVTEKLTMQIDQDLPPAYVADCRQHPAIRRTRLILLILLTVEVARQTQRDRQVRHVANPNIPVR